MRFTFKKEKKSAKRDSNPQSSQKQRNLRIQTRTTQNSRSWCPTACPRPRLTSTDSLACVPCFLPCFRLVSNFRILHASHQPWAGCEHSKKSWAASPFSSVHLSTSCMRLNASFTFMCNISALMSEAVHHAC